jgi:hypothetical protein
MPHVGGFDEASNIARNILKLFHDVEMARLELEVINIGPARRRLLYEVSGHGHDISLQVKEDERREFSYSGFINCSTNVPQPTVTG